MSVHDIFLSNTVKCLYMEFLISVQERSNEIMEKTKRIEIRLSDNEFKELQIQSKRANISKSDYIRKTLFNTNTFIIDKKGMAASIVKMQFAVNRIVQLGFSEEILNELTKEMDLLWQYLN